MRNGVSSSQMNVNNTGVASLKPTQEDQRDGTNGDAGGGFGAVVPTGLVHAVAPCCRLGDAEQKNTGNA